MTFGIIYHENTCLQLIFACNLGLLTSHSSRGDKFEIASTDDNTNVACCAVSQDTANVERARISYATRIVSPVYPRGGPHTDHETRTCVRGEKACDPPGPLILKIQRNSWKLNPSYIPRASRICALASHPRPLTVYASAGFGA